MVLLSKGGDFFWDEKEFWVKEINFGDPTIPMKHAQKVISISVFDVF